jgi:hypothetical protein
MSALTGVIATHGSSYTVTRRATGAYASGIWVDGATSTITIRAHVQPVTGRDLKTLPEGQRTEDARIVYTTTELKATAGGPDSIAIGGEAYEVIKVETWSGLGGTHYRAVVARVATS